MLDFNLLEGMLKTKEIGRTFLQFESLQSTHKKARSIIRQCPNGMVIFAEEQWNALTKKGNGWYSPDGGIYFSIIIHSHSHEDFSELLNLILIQSILDAISMNCKGIQFSIPNDLWMDNQKIGCTTIEKIGKDQEFSYILNVFLNYDIQKQELGDNVQCPAGNLRTQSEGTLLKEHIISNILNGLEKNMTLYINEAMRSDFLSGIYEKCMEYGRALQIKKTGNKRWIDIQLRGFDLIGRVVMIKQEQMEILDFHKYEVRMIDKQYENR